MYPKPIKIASVKNFKETWKESRDSRGKGGAKGSDGVTPIRYRENLEVNICRLREKLLDGTYKFRGLKPYFIQKDGGGYRVICVPSVEDRLLQRLILKHLSHGSNDKLSVVSPISFGSRKGPEQSVHAAIDKAIEFRQVYSWVLKTDISKFFDNIPRKYLKRKVRARLGRSSLVPIIYKAIDCEVSTENIDEAQEVEAAGIKKGVGLRQGMPLSPLLSNLVLSDFDHKVYRKKLRVIRYADDIIVFCQSEEDARQAFKFIRDQLEKLSLEVPELGQDNTKSEIKGPNDPVIFLGVEIYLNKSNKYGKRVPNSTIQRARDRIKQHADLKWNIKHNYDYSRVTQRLNDIPDGYKSAFTGCVNINSFLDVLEQDCNFVKQSLLEDIFGSEVFAKISDKEKVFMGFI